MILLSSFIYASSIALKQVLLPYVFLVLISSFVISNFVEYCIHRWPMHKMSWLKSLYKTHSGIHHRYYTHKNMDIKEPYDFLMAITNFKATTFLILFIILPLSGLSALLFGVPVGYSMYSSLVINFLIYEFTHLATHSSDFPIFKLKYFKNAKKRHTIHHNTKLMRHFNFNVSYPIFDRFYRTIYK